MFDLYFVFSDLFSKKVLLKHIKKLSSHQKFFIQSIEIVVMDSKSVIQKNRKKEILQSRPLGDSPNHGLSRLPPMKLYLMDMDEATKHESSRNVGHPASPSWPFSMLITGKSGSGKTNILANLFLGDKAEYIYKGKKGGSRYIACDDLIVCGYHPDEPKWAFVRKMYGIISKDPKAPYYENIRFRQRKSLVLEHFHQNGVQRLFLRMYV